MSEKYDVIVLGAGPGGYPAAIRSAQLGKKTAIVETKWIGGECLNWGCIPSKALISAANFYHRATHEAADMGIIIEKSKIDMKKMQEWKQGIQDRLIGGIKQLLKGNKVDIIMGTGKLLSKNTLEVTKDDGSKEVIEGDNIIISTGASFISIPGFQIDEQDILSAKGALSLDHVPEELLCIGGGIIGLELGSVFARLGSKVTFVELLDEILPGVEPSLIRILKRKLKKEGVVFHTASTAKGFTKKGNGKLEVDVETKKEGMIKISADKILLAVGKKALTKDIGIENLGIKTDRGYIIVDTKLRTNVPNIYAVGDCTGMPFLAHRATKQGIVAAEVIAGKSSEFDVKSMPGAIFTEPEIAFTGLSESQAKEQGFEIITGRVPFAISGKAMAHQLTDGFVKVIVDKKTEVILGVEMVGPEVSNLISEASLAIEMGATAEDLGFTVHPHPTLPEVLMEACEAALGKAVHVMNPLKRNN
jgi:dihydrolipoamide dehydrogenase